MKVLRAPKAVFDEIEKFANMEIAGKKISCPYFINSGGFLKSPVYSGKGTPDEIVLEIKKYLTKIGNHEYSEEELIQIMKSKGIGIDCSGLVYDLLDIWVRENKISLTQNLPKVNLINIRKFISRMIKPQNSINADEFTSEPFGERVNIIDIKPGDLIRTRAGKHILIILEVEYDERLTPKKIKYLESASKYKKDGVRYGEIYLNDDLNLNTSRWVTSPREDINFTYEGWREGINTNGVFRPIVLSLVTQ